MKILTLSPLLLILCGGCSSQYNVALSNGEVITTRGKPHLNAEKTMWVFKDSSGQTNYIPAGNVSQVGPSSMGDSDAPAKFNPTSNK